jgi:hypothetical protein
MKSYSVAVLRWCPLSPAATGGDAGKTGGLRRARAAYPGPSPRFRPRALLNLNPIIVHGLLPDLLRPGVKKFPARACLDLHTSLARRSVVARLVLRAGLCACHHASLLARSCSLRRINVSWRRAAEPSPACLPACCCSAATVYSKRSMARTARGRLQRMPLKAAADDAPSRQSAPAQLTVTIVRLVQGVSLNFTLTYITSVFSLLLI